jgi:hypothetical protein
MTKRPNGMGPAALSFIAGLAAVISAASCSSPRPDAGTNTNWLCNTDADCTKLSASAVCTGGVCKSKGTDAGTRADAATELPACTWPANLGRVDASARDVCDAARALLNCGPPTGTQEICMSDNATRCPLPDPAGGPYLPCESQCGANEYVAECGGVGPGSIPDPPAGCRPALGVPAGIAFYCCPCGG